MKTNIRIPEKAETPKHIRNNKDIRHCPSCMAKNGIVFLPLFSNRVPLQGDLSIMCLNEGCHEITPLRSSIGELSSLRTQVELYRIVKGNEKVISNFTGWLIPYSNGNGCRFDGSLKIEIENHHGQQIEKLPNTWSLCAKLWIQHKGEEYASWPPVIETNEGFVLKIK